MNNQNELFLKAQSVAQKAYAPYSHFKVGAAVQASSGAIYVGCNVENVSYPVGTCAEQAAIAAMVAGGDKQIETILIYADSQTLITPCGACRQRIAELAGASCVVLLANSQGIQKQYTIAELLPCSFAEF
jgi:cytidine deaminase